MAFQSHSIQRRPVPLLPLPSSRPSLLSAYKEGVNEKRVTLEYSCSQKIDKVKKFAWANNSAPTGIAFYFCVCACVSGKNWGSVLSGIFNRSPIPPFYSQPDLSLSTFTQEQTTRNLISARCPNSHRQCEHFSGTAVNQIARLSPSSGPSNICVRHGLHSPKTTAVDGLRDSCRFELDNLPHPSGRQPPSTKKVVGRRRCTNCTRREAEFQLTKSCWWSLMGCHLM